MEEFNREVLSRWLLCGFKFIKYRKFDNYSATLEPFKEMDYETDAGEGSYFLDINDEQVAEMAAKSIPLLENFTFYVHE